MFLVLKFFFDEVKYPAVILIIFSLLSLLFNIWFPHEVFAMDPYYNVNSDEDMTCYEDVRNSLIISRKESYESYGGRFTYNTREDLLESLYPNGLLLHPSIIHDSYDGENYFDIPITMIYGGSENINLSPGIYSDCRARNIDGLLIWPERHPFHVEFVKDYTEVLPKESIISSVSLGTKTNGDEFVFIYIKCQDIYKHNYYWTIWERTHLAKYWSYKAFKKRWDSETNIWSNIDENIRKDIVIEVKDLLGIVRINEHYRKTVRSEVEKVVRKTFPTISF